MPSSSAGGHDDCRQPDLQRLGRADPPGRWHRSPGPGRSQRSRPAALFPSGRAPARARPPSCRSWASSATTRRSQASASWKPAPIAWPWTTAIETKRGSRSQVKPALEPSMALETSSSGCPAAPTTDSAVAGRPGGSSIARSRPGGEALARAPDDDHPDVVGDLVADVRQRAPHRRASGRCAPRAGSGSPSRPRRPRRTAGRPPSSSGVMRCTRRNRRRLRPCDRGDSRPARPGRRSRRSRGPRRRRGGSAPGRARARATAPSSWVTSTIAPS